MILEVRFTSRVFRFTVHLPFFSEFASAKRPPVRGGLFVFLPFGSTSGRLAFVVDADFGAYTLHHLLAAITVFVVPTVVSAQTFDILGSNIFDIS